MRVGFNRVYNNHRAHLLVIGSNEKKKQQKSLSNNLTPPFLNIILLFLWFFNNMKISTWKFILSISCFNLQFGPLLSSDNIH